MSSPGWGRLGDDPRGALRTLGGPMLGLLAVQFLLGMTLNLFVTVPSDVRGIAVLWSSPALLLHVIVGVAVVGIFGRGARVAARTQDSRLLATGGLGLVGAVLAFLAGLSFVFEGQTAGASMVMAVGFLVATIVAGIFLAQPQARVAAPASVSRSAVQGSG
jgi:hypothetical protein